jgi:hypothetical protein
MIIQYLRKNDGKTELTGRRVMTENDELQDEIRIHRGTPIGVVVAIRIGTGFSIGWSKCNKKDTFIKVRGLQIAEARALMGQYKVYSCSDAAFLLNPVNPNRIKETPIGMKPIIEKVIQRSCAYFLKKNLVEISEDVERKACRWIADVPFQAAPYGFERHGLPQ